MRILWGIVVLRPVCAALVVPAAFLQLILFSGGLSFLPPVAVAGSCIGAGAPYTIGAQNDTVELDADCAAAGGAVTVSGNVTGDGLGSGQAVIHDQPGNEQDWAVTINTGVTVQDIVNVTAGLRFESANGSLDNSGTVNVTREAVLFSGVVGSVINRAGATLTSTGAGSVALLSGGTVNNAGTISASAGSTGVNLEQSGTIENSGSISGGRGVLFSNFANDGMADIVTLTNTASGTITATNAGADGVLSTNNEGGSATITNHGTISGGANNAGIRFNSFNGPTGTIVNSGTINGGALGAIVFNDVTATNDVLELQPGFVINGNVLGNGGTDILRLGGTGNGTFDLGTIDTGANTLQYRSFESFMINSGNWTLTGATNVPFTQNGGTVSGNSTFGDFTVNGGTVAPGNSIGTTHVAGNFVFNQGATYQVEIDNTPASDLISATGTATLKGGTVQVATLSPDASFTDGTVYTILNAAGGVTGTFDTLSETSTFLDFLLSYNATQVLLTLNFAGDTGTIDFTTPAQTRNQVAAAKGFNGLGRIAGTDSVTVFNALALLSAPQARAAYDASSGEIHASLQQGVLDTADLFAGTLQRRAGLAGANDAGVAVRALSFGPKVPTTGRPGQSLISGEDGAVDRSDTVISSWVGVLGGRNDYDGSGNEAAFDQNTYGFAGGLDVAKAWQTLKVTGGIAAGYSESDADVVARASSADVTSWHVGLYGALERGPLRLSGALSYAAHDIGTTRHIVFPGINRTAAAKYDADTLAASMEAVWRIDLNKASDFKWTVAPLVTMDVRAGSHDRASETGAGALDLAIASQSFERIEGGAGLALGYSGRVGKWAVKSEARAVWKHAFDESNPTQSLALAGAAATPFTSSGVDRGTDRLALGFGVHAKLSNRVSLGTRYDGTFLGDATSHQGSVALNVRLN